MKEIISRKNNSNSNKGQREKLFATIDFIFAFVSEGKKKN